MEKTFNLILAAVAILLGALLLARQTKIRELEREINSFEAAASATERAAIEAEPDTPAEVAAIEEPVRDGVAAPGEERKRIPIKKRTRSEFLEMMNDPKRQDFMAAAWSLELDRTYGPIFRYFEMNQEELRYLRSLVVEKRMRKEEFGLKMLEPGTTAADRERLLRESEKAAREVDGRIRDFLGDEAYAEFEGYEESVPERNMLADYKLMMENRGMALDYEQEDALIRMMYTERENSPELGKLFRGPDVPPKMTPEAAARHVRAFDAWRERVTVRASGILEPAQMPAFTNHLAGMRDAVEVGLTMAPLLVGEDGEQ